MRYVILIKQGGCDGARQLNILETINGIISYASKDFTPYLEKIIPIKRGSSEQNFCECARALLQFVILYRVRTFDSNFFYIRPHFIRYSRSIFNPISPGGGIQKKMPPPPPTELLGSHRAQGKGFKESEWQHNPGRGQAVKSTML